MLLLMLVGLALVKVGILTDDVTKKIGRMLVSVIIPAVVLKAFLGGRTADGMAALGVSFGLAAVAVGVSTAMSFALYGLRRPIDDFACTYSNPSFFAIPLIVATFGQGAVFYITGFIAMLNVLQWTYGAWMLTGDAEKINPRAILLSPMLLALALGLAIYVVGIPVPGVIYSTIDFLTQLNTPLAMMVLGSYLAKLTPRALLLDASAYAAVAVRNVLIPLATIGVLWLLRAGSTPLTLSILLAAIAPVGGNVAIYAQQFGGDYARAVKLVSLSTVLTVITVPAMFQLATMIL